MQNRRFLSISYHVSISILQIVFDFPHFFVILSSLNVHSLCAFALVFRLFLPAHRFGAFLTIFASVRLWRKRRAEDRTSLVITSADYLGKQGLVLR